VTLRPYSLRLDLGSAAGNAVPAPRSNRGTFYSQVPTVLRVFNPAFAVTQDSQLGVSETAHLSTDLLTLPSMLKGRPSDDKRASLTLAAGGSKSLDKPFYQARSDLALDVRRTGKLVERYSAGLGAWAVEQPVGGGTHFDNSIETGGGVMLRPGMRGVSGVTLGSSYRWSNHRFFESDVSPGESTDEHAVKARALADGRAGDGTWRAAGWFEAASPVEETFAPYARLALLGGYQVEIGPTEQTVGLEVLGGAGWAGEAVSRPVIGTIRTIPGYARFYAGTPASRFLYDAPDTPAMQAFPTGPILRSFGRAERGVRHDTGVERYWHVNLNVTVPLPGLSCPLVPAIPLFDDGASKDMSASPCRVRRPAAGVTTLKDSMNGAVNSGESFLRADIADELVQQGVDPDEADRQAEKRAAAVFRDIRPAMRFLTEKANLYAVKPLFMADAARIMTDGTGDASVRVAVGGGVQVAIAVAKFEAGYLHTVRGAAGDPSGNFIVRFVVANLF
jgi:hypothetical protein